MSEPGSHYYTGNNDRLPPEVLEVCTSNNYRPPTSNEVRILLRSKGWTGSHAARLVGVDSRAVRRWTADESAKTYHQIPYSAWRLLLLEAGLVSVGQKL
jgi:hypothetical protein